MEKKRILIAGKGSYIGTSFIKYVSLNNPETFDITELNMRDPSWKNVDFSRFDSIFYTAAIVHRKERDTSPSLYYRINRDLALETAQKAQREGVRQFVYFSTMSVYGKNTGQIKQTDPPSPVTHYGKSKLQAEQQILRLKSSAFHIAILRPPMVYGPRCKGNFQKLCRFVSKCPLFPDHKNTRSAIHINELCGFLAEIVLRDRSGIFFPQNKEYISTSELVRSIAAASGRKVYFTPVFEPLIRLGLLLRIPVFEKLFGDLTYEKE